MESPTPPTPRAMSDDALNAEVMRLQSQPDGLMAAMALIEAQNLLRQQDSFAYSQWQLQEQMKAASAPVEVREPDPKAADPVVTPAAVAPSVSSGTAVPEESSIDEIVSVLNSNYANSENEGSAPLLPPVPALAPASKKISFDQLISGEEESVADLLPNPADTSVQPELAEDEDGAQVIGVTRTKTSAALSWSWISIASSPLVLVLAAFLKESGTSLAQSLVVMSGLIVTTAVLAGIG